MPSKIRMLLLAPLTVLLAPIARAHCPLCTVAVGSAAVTAKYFGLDNSIIGVFIGAFGVSTGLWLALRLKKYVPMQTPLIVTGSLLLTAIPLIGLLPETTYFPVLLAGQAGSALNKAYFFNSMLMGSVIGAIATIGSYLAHTTIKKARGKVLFPFQGIALTLFALLVVSGALYFITR